MMQGRNSDVLFINLETKQPFPFLLLHVNETNFMHSKNAYLEEQKFSSVIPLSLPIPLPRPLLFNLLTQNYSYLSHLPSAALLPCLHYPSLLFPTYISSIPTYLSQPFPSHTSSLFPLSLPSFPCHDLHTSHISYQPRRWDATEIPPTAPTNTATITTKITLSEQHSFPSLFPLAG